LPNSLPITAGRIHFIRKVKPDGIISVLNETWKVSNRLTGKYVWATVITHGRRLEIWYQRSAQHDWRLLKTYVSIVTTSCAVFWPISNRASSHDIVRTFLMKQTQKQHFSWAK
jgi:hypothetical protein